MIAENGIHIGYLRYKVCREVSYTQSSFLTQIYWQNKEKQLMQTIG